MTQIAIPEFVEAVAAGAYVLDVREAAEFAAGHVPGAVSMPMALIPVRDNEMPSARMVYVVCETGGRSAQAAMFLARKGVDVVNVSGGMAAWRLAGLPTVKGGQQR